MRKYLFLLVALISTSVLSAQEFVYETFYNLQTDRSYDLEVYLNDEDQIDHIFIEVDGNYDEVFIKVKRNQLDAFHNALRQAKSKFLEWQQVAKDNNVLDFYKAMDITFPEIEAYWYCDNDWKDSFGKKPQVLFIVNEEGESFVSVGTTVTDWEDDSYEETYVLILGYSLDFDDLINRTKLTYIQNKVNEKAIDSLFRDDNSGSNRSNSSNSVESLFT